MSSERFGSFEQMVDAVYAAPASDMGWASAVEPLERALRGRVAMFEQSSAGVSVLARCSAIGQSSVEDYLGRFWSSDLAMRNLRDRPLGAIVADSELGTDKVRTSDGREFYDCYLDRINGHHGVYASVHDEGGSRFVFSVRRGLSEGDFAGPEKARIALLRPHLERSLRMWTKMRDRSTLLSATMNVLEDCGYGCLLVDQDLAIHEAAPVSLLERPSMLVRTSSDGHPTFTGAALAAGIGRLVKDVLKANDGRARTAVLDGGLGKKLPISVRPFRHNDLTSDRARLAVVSFPTGAPPPAVNILQREYRLTHAETRLVESLAAGHSLSDYALQAGLKRSTVKSHLDSVFSKTGDRRQADLIRRVLSLRPAGR